MKTLLASVAVLLSGCVSQPLSIDSTSGEYEMGGFNEMTTLSLRSDGSYRISQLVMSCVIEDGKITLWQDEESGRWSLDGGVVCLETAAQAPRDYYAWFSRLRVTQNRGKKILVSDVRSAPVYGRLCFTQKKPNKAPEPTPGSVTPRASSGNWK